MRVVPVSPAESRAAIARAWLGHAPAESGRLAAVTLRPHQLRALPRLRRALRDFGGALLADAVGLGKSYVALALARDAARPLVVAPAALRATWQRAAATAGVRVDFVSFEALSRATPPFVGQPDAPPDLVVVDEAHHARNPATRRHRALAELAARARVLLLTATPVHNRRRELVALLALFLGERAESLDPATLARLVVRRTSRDVDAPALPVVRRTRWLRLPDAPEVLAALRAVPPPLPPRDGGTADALWSLALVRLWASSDGALRAALRRRLARAAALAAALDQGRHLSRRDLRRWAVDESVVQLELPIRLPDDVPTGDRAALLDTLRAHERALRAALDALPATDPRDAVRAAHLRDLRRRHPGQPILAFTHSADTARTLYRLLAPDGGVALLTGAGGRVAGGAVPRHELVARFAPRASGLPPPRPADRVDLLLATDCLSEGLDLHDAAVVVHLDLPWTPARLAQRVGRAARLGAAHAEIAVYGFAPPGGAAAWLRLAARLRAKSSVARAAVGPGTLRAGRGVGPAPLRPPSGAGPPWLRVARTLERWATTAPCAGPALPSAALAVSAVAAPVVSYLALCLEGGRAVLLAGHRGRASASPGVVARVVPLVDAATARSATPSRDRLRCILRELRRCARARASAALAGGRADAPQSGLRGEVLARAGALVAGAPPHLRAATAARADAVRRAARRPWSAGLERAVAALAPLADGAWLPAVADALRPPAGDAPHVAPAEGGRPFRIVTIVVLGP